MQRLRQLQAAQGATFEPASEITPEPVEVEHPLSFGNDRAALEAGQTGVALYDRSHWGRILLSGADRLRFLHNQTTNAIQTLVPGQGCDTTFVTSTGRTIDLVTAYVLEDAILLLVSPGYSRVLIEWMDRFIFFADKVELQDISQNTIAFSLVGPESDAIIEKLGMGAIVGQPAASHRLFARDLVKDQGTIRVAVGSGLDVPGYTVFTEAEYAADLWQALAEAGAVPLGEQAWELLRIQRGRPAAARELTEEVNPLEAGLWHTISLSKGCYIGQETIARLHTYKGVKQQLWGVRLSQPAMPETPITSGDEKVGRLTSCTQVEMGAASASDAEADSDAERYLGLAYIRTKAIAPDLQIQVNGRPAEWFSLPYLTHDYPE